MECCLFTPWESNLFVTHNQYPAKNHHLRQNQRFPPAKSKFKKKIQIVAQNTFAPDRAAGIVKSRQQVAIFLLTWHQLKKTCNLPSSIDIVRFCFLSESCNKFRLNSLHLILWFSIQIIQEKIFCKSNDGDASK